MSQELLGPNLNLILISPSYYFSFHRLYNLADDFQFIRDHYLEQVETEETPEALTGLSSASGQVYELYSLKQMGFNQFGEEGGHLQLEILIHS